MKYSLSVVTIAFLCAPLIMTMNGKKHRKSHSWSDTTAHQYIKHTPNPLHQAKESISIYYKEKPVLSWIYLTMNEDDESDDSTYTSEELKNMYDIIKDDQKAYEDAYRS